MAHTLFELEDLYGATGEDPHAQFARNVTVHYTMVAYNVPVQNYPVDLVPVDGTTIAWARMHNKTRGVVGRESITNTAPPAQRTIKELFGLSE